MEKIPKHWIEERAKYFFREVDERSMTGDEELLSVSHVTGVTPRSQKNITMFKAESYEGYKLCKPHDLVINTMWAWMGALGVSKYSGIVSSGYGVYRPLDEQELLSEYVDSLLRTDPYKSEYYCRSTGIRSSRFRLYPEQFLRMPLICPPHEEQEKMMAFLQMKDRQIKRYIRTKLRLIDLLIERKQAIIHHAVTRGIDPNVKLKPTGIVGHADVPEHWEKICLGYSAELIVPMRDKPQKFGGDIPWIRIEDFNGKYIYESKSAQMVDKTTIHDLNLKVFPIGTVLCSCSCRMGATAIVTKPLVTNQTFIGIVPKEKLFTDFVYYLMQSYSDRLQMSATGAIQQYLSRDDFHQIRLFVPSFGEQKLISEYLDREIAQINDLILKMQNEIKDFRDYRIRLISDVVTGKVDVRNIEIVDDAPIVDDLVDDIDELDDNADDNDDDLDSNDRDDDK